MKGLIRINSEGCIVIVVKEYRNMVKEIALYLKKKHRNCTSFRTGFRGNILWIFFKIV